MVPLNSGSVALDASDIPTPILKIAAQSRHEYQCPCFHPWYFSNDFAAPNLESSDEARRPFQF